MSLELIKANGLVFSNRPIKCLLEYFQIIHKIDYSFDKEIHLWYRGVSSESYKLIPKEYRPDFRDDLAKVRSVQDDFLNRAKGFDASLKSNSKWEWYQLMQHYGIPTRLLDWTEGHLLALYFAIGEHDGNCNPVVWAMDPYYLNKVTLKKECVYYSEHLVQDDEDKILDKYFFYDKMPDFPVAFVPPASEERLFVQRSVFTIHGSTKKPIEQIFIDNPDETPRLFKISVDRSEVKRLKIELRRCGIDKVNVYPGLDSIANASISKYYLNK